MVYSYAQNIYIEDIFLSLFVYNPRNAKEKGEHTLRQWHDWMPNLTVKSVTIFHSQLMLRKFMNGLMLILINKLSNFHNSVRRYGADRPLCVFIIVNRHPTGLEKTMLFNTSYMAPAFLTEYLCNHVNVSIPFFLRLAQDLMHTHYSFS